MGKFETEYEKLNDEQKDAVDTLQGPLLVVAGPGTGKTQLLSMRVANILLKSDVYPDNILCLTFTNKATANMQERLLRLMGPEAHGVQVRTFHGLAAEIMNRYPQYFWRGARLAIAADAVQLEVMQQVLNRLPPEHPLALKFAGQFTLVNDVSRSVNLAKDAGLTPDKLRAVIASNLAYIDQIEPTMTELGGIKVGAKSIDKIESIVASLPEQPINELIKPLVSLQTVIADSFEQAVHAYNETGKTTPISKWKARWLQKQEGEYGMFTERSRNEWWLAIADAYEQYRIQLHLRGYYDYADMLVEVIGQIEQHAELRATLQERFQYVLIDEFQDTNAAQLRLAHLIADHADLASPNIMAVGDDDQSIFKFQGAELSNMLGFTRQYIDAKTIVLTDNYRSTQAVLDATATIIEHAQYRLVTQKTDLIKNLIAVSPPKDKGVIQARTYRSREEQLSDIAKIAGKLLHDGKTVAILARHHSTLRDMAGLLNAQHVPIAYEQSNNILEQPAIEQLYLILKTISHIKKGDISTVNELLSLTLRHPMWNIPPKKLWAFAISQQKVHDWLSGLTGSEDSSLAAIGAWLNWLTNLSTHEPLAVIVEYVLGLRDSELLVNPLQRYYFQDKAMTESYIETLSATQMLRSLVAEFRSVGVSRVEDFVRFTDLMTANGKIIADTSPFVSGEKCVELLSVHKAKGLEFDSVIIADAIDGEWSPSSYGRVPPANLPLRPAEDDTDDYVRLMYVAATRAKHTLLFSNYQLNQKGDDVLAARSISQIPVVMQPPVTGEKLAEVLESALAWPQLEQTDENALLGPLLENFHLNVSNLINFLDITHGGPQLFKERNLLRLPGAKSPAAAMGTAVHDALQEAQQQFTVGKIDMDGVLKHFDSSLLAQGLPEADFRKKLAEGRRTLKRFIQNYHWEFSKGALPEYAIANIFCGDAKIGGTLDVLDMTGDNLIVQDYKTGRPLTSLVTTYGDAGVKAWRHKLQLIFYALLLELDPAIRVKGSIIGQMIYVESDSKSKLVQEYTPSKDDLTRAGSLVQAVWQRVMKLDFPDISKYSSDAKGITAFEDDLINGNI